MPLYELTCKACGLSRERFLWEYVDPRLEPCPFCGAQDNEDTFLEEYSWEYVTALGCG
jgi:predicted nucleic acid-binding Zn ribbon protein